MEVKIDWFNAMTNAARDYSDGEVWSDGNELLCKTESAADAISDLLWQLYHSQGEDVLPHMGYYDPEEDARSGETDRYTGWWYVDLD